MINSVILFIRDTLPIFLLVSLLLSQSKVGLFPLLVGVSLGLLVACGLYLNLAALSMLAEGGGLELIKAVVLFATFIVLCIFISDAIAHSKRISLWATLVVVGITITNAIHFLIYSIAYWSVERADTSLIMGSIIGLGISLSVSVLLHSLVNAIRSTYVKLSALCVFCAGQFAGATLLLEQIDYLGVTERLWDASDWVADDSEYGHLLNVLFGYEATPSIAYISVYLLTVSMPFAYALIVRSVVTTRHEKGALL
ncbi:FTR1 family iron permease [Alteromonas sp. A079]|uniref:FTR1 family iron permease n=1 Tax=Alteromonas sp. A079 TaxID=3410268 RepID=UPI003BA06E22